MRAHEAGLKALRSEQLARRVVAPISLVVRQVEDVQRLTAVGRQAQAGCPAGVSRFEGLFVVMELRAVGHGHGVNRALGVQHGSTRIIGALEITCEEAEQPLPRQGTPGSGFNAARSTWATKVWSLPSCRGHSTPAGRSGRPPSRVVPGGPMSSVVSNRYAGRVSRARLEA